MGWSKRREEAGWGAGAAPWPGWSCPLRSAPPTLGGSRQQGEGSHPRGTCRKEANGHPTQLVGTSSQEKAAFQQSCVLRTHEHLVPLLLCIPHTSTSSPLECWTVLPLLLPIHLSSLFSRVQAMPLPLRRLALNPHWQGGGTLYSVSQFWGHDLRLLLGQNGSPLSAPCYLPQP